MCQTAERFYAVSTVLNNMVMNQLEKPSTRLLKHIIRCYNRLAENPRARLALKENLPILLKEIKLQENLDESSKKCLKNLNEVIQSESMTPGQSTISAAGSEFGESMMTGFSLNSSIDAGLKQP